MKKIKSFEDLNVWQAGKELTVDIYEMTKDFPKEEAYGITSQIKRAVLSVPAIIAEGFGRYHYLDKAKFYLNAKGSLYELKSHLLIARDLGFVVAADIDHALGTIDNLALGLNNLISSTRNLKQVVK